MDIRIISLEEAIERHQHMSDFMNKNKLIYKWFNALKKENAIKLATQLNLIKKIDTTSLSSGEIGCMMSHIALWYEMVEQKIQWMCILEDDIHLGNNTQDFLGNTNWIPSGFDCIKLEKMDNSIIVYNSPIYNINDRKLSPLAGCHLGAAGYILSLEGANKLIDYLNKINTIAPIDRVIFEEVTNLNFFTTLQMHPALCIQDDVLNKNKESLVSYIEKERQSIKKRKEEEIKHQQNIFSKVKREILRLKNQFVNILSNMIKKRHRIDLDYQ